MSETRFNLIFEGKIEPGHDQDEARRTLGSLFESDAETEDDLFSGQPVILGESMDATTANSFKQALAGAGITTYLLATKKAAETREYQTRRSIDRRSSIPRRARARGSSILPDRRKGVDPRS